MCLDMFLNDASLPYQYLGDSQAENREKSKHIAYLEQNIAELAQTLKAKDEHIAYLEQNIADHEQTLKKKDEHIERINNSLINLSGHMAQFSFPQCSQFVRAPQFVPQGPQVIARTIPPLIVPKAFQRRSGRSGPYS